MDAVSAWPLDLPLLHLSPRPEDVWTLDDASRGVLVMGETRSGKCLGRDTPVMLASGKIVPVQDVREGDLLMGDDSTPRKVLSTTQGYGKLYKVIPTKGDPWICNDVHVMTLSYRGTRTWIPKMTVDGKRIPIANVPPRPPSRPWNDVIDIPLAEFLEKHADANGYWKLMRAPVEWEESPQSSAMSVDDFYFVGLWLGDGVTGRKLNGKAQVGIQLHNVEHKIKEWLKQYAHRKGWVFQEKSRRTCPALKLLQPRAYERRWSGTCTSEGTRMLVQFGHGSNKTIPLWALTAPKEKRLALLAGIIDTDGSLLGGCFDIVQKSKPLADQICFLARSLGFWSQVNECKKGCQTGAVGTYYRQHISGNTHLIPTRVERKKASQRKQISDVSYTGWRAEPYGYGDYYGFTLDGNGRFLLGDFTVTHNTTGSGRRMALNYLRAGFGGLVLCFRVNEAALWRGYLKEAGREQDGRFFGVGQPHRFNFLDYESRVAGVEWAESLVMLLLDVGSIQRRTESASAEAHFWQDQKAKLLRNAITLLMLTGEPIQLKTLYRMIVDAPKSDDQARSADWKQASFVWELLKACEKKAGNHPEWPFLQRYWMRELPALHPKQRESIFADFTGMFDPLSRFAFGELFCTSTNLTPDDILNGAVVVVDLPVAKYRRVGQYAALIWSQLFQRAADRREYHAPESRPVFLWQDEAQHFIVEQDAVFQTTAGGQGLLAVRLTQNLPNFLDAFGPAGKNKVDTLLGNHAGLKVFHRNGDPETNQWASRVIAKETQYRASVSSGYSSGLTGYNVTVNEVEEDSCPPKAFIGLKNGGPLNRWIVEGVVFQSGRLIDGQRWVIRRWKQK